MRHRRSWLRSAPATIPCPHLPATQRGHRPPDAHPHRRRGLDRLIGAWVSGQQPPPSRPPSPGRPQRAVAVDGKTLSGSGLTSVPRCTCWRPWTMPPCGPGPGRCRWQDQRDHPVPAAAGRPRSTQHGHDGRRDPHATRARHLAGRGEARRLRPAGKDNQPAFTTSSRLCPGPTSRWPTVPATVPTAVVSSAAFRSPPCLACGFPMPPRPFASPAGSAGCAVAGGAM